MVVKNLFERAVVVHMNTPIQAIATNSPPIPNLTLKLETKFTPNPISQLCTGALVVMKQEEESLSPTQKKIKLENNERNRELNCLDSPIPEMKDATTCISMGTITEPDCLGPCEPGTSVMLEGIVWKEAEGGVLVVNVTWIGKPYVGTLFDCTKYDWAPPKFCESLTSDVDSKAFKGLGKRGRNGNNSSSDMNFADTRNCVQSKLRNDKGRRTTVNSNASSAGFTVPNNLAKSGETAIQQGLG